MQALTHEASKEDNRKDTEQASSSPRFWHSPQSKNGQRLAITSKYKSWSPEKHEKGSDAEKATATGSSEECDKNEI